MLVKWTLTREINAFTLQQQRIDVTVITTMITDNRSAEL